MQLRFLGAAREVTGSCFLLETGQARILIDCGLIQGSPQDEARNRDPFDFDPAGIDAVVLTHAHLDHSGRVPLLIKAGYRG
ncbi:MAG: MBL fold metallo-hydrolase, partial [Gammaproteobacteria bacterium]